MSSRENGSSSIVQLDEVTFPACNIHSFIFSDPFSPTSPLVKKVDAETGVNNATFPPISLHKPIFYDPKSSTAVTYSRLRRDTLRIAHGIHQRFGSPRLTEAFGNGSCAGPVVLVHLSNTIVWPVIVLGFLAAGWTVTGTNPGYTASELAHVIELCEPSAVVCYPGVGGEDNIRAACETARHTEAQIMLVEPGDDAYGLQSKGPGAHNWTSLLSERELEVSPLSAPEADRRVAIIMWTSGTTGKPKGAMVTHRALVAGLIVLWSGSPGYLPDERWIGVAPFYHIFGLYHQVLITPCIGATVILLTKFNLEEYLRLATVHKATHLHIAPPIAVALAKSDLIDEPWCTLESVVAATSGGAPLSPEIIREVWKRIRVVIKMGYGLTETGSVTSFRGDSWDDISPQLATSGSPLYSVKVTIVGEDGKPVDEKTPGEILISSPAQMLGYLKNPQATAETLDGDGVHTGDIGYIDDDGNLRISERMKELIKYKGFQVSPTELEAIIAALPEVQDVAVSSLYSDAQGTELPLAYIVPRDPAVLQHLTTFTNGEAPSNELVVLADKVKMAIEKNCIHYKRLRGGVIFVPAIPKSPSGKILRRLLKDQRGVHVECYTTERESRL